MRQLILPVYAALLLAPAFGCSAAQDGGPRTPPPTTHSSIENASHLAPFDRMINGRWKMTLPGGASVFDTWQWGPGRHSIRSVREGTLPDGDPLRSMSVYFWHPGLKEVRLLDVISPFRGVGEGTITFDGSKAQGAFVLHQTAGTRELGLRWTFDGPDTYHDELLDKVPGGYTVQNAWDRVRVAAADPAEAGAAANGERAPKPSEFLKPLQALLEHAWERTTTPESSTAKPDDAHVTRTSFEYMPHADMILGRVHTLNADGTPAHAMDIYLYHHTGAGVLRCLALASDGAVYEGDITPADAGRSLTIALAQHRTNGSTTLEARIDFEHPGCVRQRVWQIDQDQRTLIADLRHTAPGK